MKEVRLRNHLDGGEGVVILRHGWGREEVCAVTCAGSPPAPGDRIRSRIHIFQSCFCPFNCKIYILSVYYYSPPLVALNLRCVKWFRGRKTCISNAAPFCGTRLVAPGIVGALRGARTSSGFVSTTLPLPRYRRCLFFSPVRDYLNDKLARLRTLRGNIQILAE